jgi:hypothetical protein
MPKVIVTGQAEDAAKWEAGLRSRGDLLNKATVTTIAIGNDGNEIATCSDVTDLSRFMEVMASPDVAVVMAEDGLNQATVKIYVMDREFQP